MLRLIPLWVVIFSQANNDVVKDLLLLEKEFESEAQRLRFDDFHMWRLVLCFLFVFCLFLLFIFLFLYFPLTNRNSELASKIKRTRIQVIQ